MGCRRKTCLASVSERAKQSIIRYWQRGSGLLSSKQWGKGKSIWGNRGKKSHAQLYNSIDSDKNVRIYLLSGWNSRSICLDSSSTDTDSLPPLSLAICLSTIALGKFSWLHTVPAQMNISLRWSANTRVSTCRSSKKNSAYELFRTSPVPRVSCSPLLDSF